MDSSEKMTDYPQSTSLPPPGELIQVTGRVVQERHNGNMKRVFVIDDPKLGMTRIFLDARSYPGTSVWMTIKGASHLIFVGATLRVEGVNKPSMSSSSSSSSEPKQAAEEEFQQEIFASKVQVVAVNPSKPYLSRLFSFSLEHLWELFPSSDDTITRTKYGDGRIPPSMVLALAPCNEEECHTHYQFCQAERAAGRSTHVWKTPQIAELMERIYQYQNPIKESQKHLPPHTSRKTVAALERMEEQWCRPTDGILDDYVYHPETFTYSTNGKTTVLPKSTTNSSEDYHHHHNNASPPVRMDDAVDPAHNLPDPNDERRQRYIDERKRPQLQYMLKLIHELVEDRRKTHNKSSSSSPSSTLQLADIGGGRGYLAIAVAAYFRDTHIPVHVTAVDNNESSLEAGRERAEAANLTSSMSFLLYDLNDDKVQGEKLLPRFDVVFGLHCCGGLAEAAVELALTCMSSFCVSTCCFRSNLELATLTQLAEHLIVTRGSSNTNELRCGPTLDVSQKDVKVNVNEEGKQEDDSTVIILKQHNQDIARVSALAIAVGGKFQHRAIRTYNAMRLVAAEQRFHDHVKTNGLKFPKEEEEEEREGMPFPRLKTWQETFPVEHSVQNRILMGAIEY